MDEKMFELIEKMYTEIKKDLSDINNRMDKGFVEVNEKIDTLSKQVINLENDLKPKVEALFDGYKQHTTMLERIQQEVSRQDEIIMRRVK